MYRNYKFTVNLNLEDVLDMVGPSNILHSLTLLYECQNLQKYPPAPVSKYLWKFWGSGTLELNEYKHLLEI